MKTKYQALVFLFVVLVYSCQPDQSKTFSSFPKSYELKGNKVKDELYFKIGAINIYDSLLVVSNPIETENCIHFFDKNSFIHLLATGKIGRGPNEISIPGLGCMDQSKGIFWYRDAGKKILWEFKIKDLREGSNYMPVKSIPLPENKFFIQFQAERNDLFSYSNPDRDTLISHFNYQGEIIDSMNVPNKLKVYKKLDETTRMSTATYLYQAHPRHKLYVVAYRMADVVAIVDQKGEIVSVLKGPGKVLETPRYGSNDYVETNKQVVVSDEFIYCLYSGKMTMEMKDGEMASNYAKRLHVYSWHGTPFAEINLEYTAISFDIDFENNRLITFSPETGGIVYYDLPRFL